MSDADAPAMIDPHPETDGAREVIPRKLSRNLAFCLTAMFLLATLLSEVEITAFLTVTLQPLLVLAGMAWGAHLLLRLGVAGQRRTIMSAQGPGGAVVELATINGFRQRANDSTVASRATNGRVSDGRTSRKRAANDMAEKYFQAALRHFQRGQYAAAAGRCRQSMDARLTLAAALNLSVGLLNTAAIDAAAYVLKRSLERLAADEDPELAAALHANLGVAMARRGDLQEALKEYATATSLWAVVRDDRGHADTLLNRAQILVYLGQGCDEEVRRSCERALKVYQKRGVALGRANALIALGNFWLEKGNMDEALRLLRAALKSHEEARNTLGQGTAQTCLGHTLYRRAELSEARAAYAAAAEQFHAVGELVGEASALANVGNISFRNGDLEGAMGAYEKALEVHRRSGNALGEAQTLTNIGAVQVRQRRLGAALPVLLRARELYERTGARGRGRETADRLIARLQRRREELQQRRAREN